MKLLLLLLSGLILGSTLSFKQDDTLKESIERGKTIYLETCASCHSSDGKGVPSAFPPLAKSDYLTDSTARAIRVVKYGLQGAITVNGEEYDSMMPEPGLEDQQVADVMNYILNSWGNTNGGNVITAKQVELVQPEN